MQAMRYPCQPVTDLWLTMEAPKAGTASEVARDVDDERG